MNARITFREQCGHLGGVLLAPLTAALSGLREARMFHPDGVVYSAGLVSAASAPELQHLAERLGRTALVRFSSALWRRGHDYPDVMGVALRFPIGSAPAAHTQDLLLATIRFPWTMPFAPFATNFRSFLWNHYHAVSPFEVDGVGAVKFRLRSPRLGNALPMTRAEHLARVAAEGAASFELQLRRLDAPVWSRRWETIAKLTLMKPLAVDQAALRFSPFNSGAGIRPTGFVHALRVAAYAASQEARPASDAATP